MGIEEDDLKARSVHEETLLGGPKWSTAERKELLTEFSKRARYSEIFAYFSGVRTKPSPGPIVLCDLPVLSGKKDNHRVGLFGSLAY
jgi:hypothetical protein